MQKELNDALLECETDVRGSIKRFSGNENIYISFLKSFPDEPTMKSLRQSIKEHQWEDAFVAAHALKGLAGNLGFIPLYYDIGELVVLLRAGKYGAVDQLYKQTESSYHEIVKAIRNHLK